MNVKGSEACGLAEPGPKLAEPGSEIRRLPE